MRKLSLSPSQGFRVIAGTSRSQAATMVLAPKESTGGSHNHHATSDQWLYVISGQGKAIINGKTIKLSEKDLLLIEAGENHQIINTEDEPFKTLNIYSPPEY